MYWIGSTYVVSLSSSRALLITQNISGGKAGATAIKNDCQFLAVISVITSKAKKCQVRVEFDIDRMDRYCIHTKVSLDLIVCVIFDHV
jgi:hypothetical protein